MSKILAAYDAHSRLAVAGVKKNYSLKKIPSLNEALGNTPCIVPVFGNEAESETPNTTAGSGDVTYTANFLLLVAKGTSERGLYVVAPLAVSIIDAYCRAVANDDDLRQTLDVETAVRLRPTVREIGKDWWYAIEITHTWVFYLNPD